MSYHNVTLQHDIIHILGNAINPLPHEQLFHEVKNHGLKKQRIYRDEEISEVLEYLVKLSFVKQTGNKYEWIA